MNKRETYIVAAAQVTPMFLDGKATLEKACDTIAKEGGMFVIGCCMPLHINDIPDEFEFKKLYAEGTEWINLGGSCVINPQGEIMAGPVEDREEIIYGEVDLRLVTISKRMFDVVGHYARPDVFKFTVNRGSNTIMQITDYDAFDSRGN